MAGKEVDSISVGMEARVVSLDSVEMVVVEGMVMITVDFGLEVVKLVDLERMGDIGKIERIFHKDFAFLEPMLEKDSEIGAKIVAKDSSLAGFESS